MGVIHIEDIDERLMKSIELRAAENGRSLEDEVRTILEDAAVGDRAAQPLKSPAERFASIRAMTPKGVQQTDSTDMIREMRDRGYANY
jgi:phosphopantothenoylcysteine decarboxylase/phosphopantothenate--cysteine ligase